MAQRFPSRGFASNQGIPSRGFHRPAFNSGMQAQHHMSIPSMRGQVLNRDKQGPFQERGIQGQRPNFSMQGNMGNRDGQGQLVDRGMTDSIPSRDIHESTYVRGMQNPVANTGRQGYMSDTGTSSHMPNRNIQGSFPDRSMHDTMGNSYSQGLIMDRGRQENVSYNSMQGPTPDRHIVGNTPDNGPVGNRNMQGYLPDRRMQGNIPNSAIQGPGPNREVQGQIPYRGMQENFTRNDRQGHMPYRDNQGSVPNREMQNPLSSNLTHNNRQGQFPNRDVPGQTSDRGLQSYMPERHMQDPLLSRDGYTQGPAPERVMHRPEMPNQGMTGSSTPMSSGVPQASLMQGHFQIQQKFPGFPQSQGQGNAMSIQSCLPPSSTVSQGPIIQHVMIPVPVPVGSEIPSHLLQPRVITSTGLPSQGHFTGPQGQSQFSGMQNQSHFPGMQGQLPNMQEQGSCQDQSQSTSMQPQGSFASRHFQDPVSDFQTSDLNTPANVPGSGRDDLNYYISQDSRNRNRGRYGEDVHRYDSQRSNKYEGQRSNTYENQRSKQEHFQKWEGGFEDYEYKDYGQGFESRQRIEHEYERKDQEQFRSQTSSNFSSVPDRKEQYSNASHFSDNVREQGEGFRRHKMETTHEHFDRFGSKNSENFCRYEQFERNERNDRINEYDRFERNKGLCRDRNFEVDERPRQGEHRSHGQYENERRYISYNEIQLKQDFADHKELDKEERPGKEHSYDSNRHNDERNSVEKRHGLTAENYKGSQINASFSDQREVHSCTVEYGNEQIHDTERHSGAVLYTDGVREDLSSRGSQNEGKDDKEERFDVEFNQSKELGKRKLSPVSSERSSRKVRRDYSPVSQDSKTHRDLKIHVSDKGRWIETDDNLSPVSGDALESDRLGDKDNVNESDVRSVKDSVEGDRLSLDGAEMISDSESCIGGDDMNEDITHQTDLSPVSQQSSRIESLTHDEGAKTKNKHDAGKVSPNQSQKSGHSVDRSHSKYEDEGSIHSHKTRNSEDKQRSQSSTKKSEVYQLKVPDLCPAYSQKGCRWHGCANLHICKFFILDLCKFGNSCTKEHNFFKGQPFEILSKSNPGFKNSNVTGEQLKLILKNRISCIIPEDLQKRMTTYKIEMTENKKNEKYNVDAVDPSFDARNYAPGSNFDFNAVEKEDTKKSKSSKKILKKKNEIPKAKNTGEGEAKMTELNVSDSKMKESAEKCKMKQTGQKSNDKKKEKQSKNKKSKGNKNKKIAEKGKANKNKPAKTVESDDENVLSPVSGDEDDWEKYEKYETISEDGLPEEDEKKDDLDDVSSDESIEQVQVNRSVDSFPLPTPENIAVPIGMNDPLVFNRPLKNNPQSYIGPMNRPPPMFPIATDGNKQLFPLASQNMQPATVASTVPRLPVGVPGPVPGPVPNHLPTPEFMQHVIQNLPKFSVEGSNQINVFKNDNNPVVVVKETPKKKNKSDKVERDPALKQTIKKLWKFPHKGVINMSIIEFVTETEAYKEELIAEIVRILVTLELPYVTMKKLLAVIKEKVSINVKSETDLRKILEMYPNNFKIIETVDSDDETDDYGSKKSFQIKANIGLGFCEKHGFLPFAIGKCECNALHLCKFYFLSDCPNKLCKFGHKLKTDHNVAVLRQHKLHRLTGEEIMNFLADVHNRRKETIPSICKYYIREKGCYKGDSTDYDTTCHCLHLCSYIVRGKCMNRECDRSHSIRDKQPLSLLKKYGLDPDELGDETVLQILGERALESDKDRGKKLLSKQQSVPGKSLSDTLAGTLHAKTSSPGEGLTILNRSETKISTKFFVQNFKVPAVCKFYQNEMGCRKKDWGAEGKCFFLHICQHYVTGDCKFGSNCKRSHDLFSGQAAEILEKYNFDLENMSANEILQRLNSNSGAPVELPRDGNTDSDKVKVEITTGYVGQSSELDCANVDALKHAKEVETRLNVEGNERFSADSEKKITEMKESSTAKQKSANESANSLLNCNIEDVIKHIMEHNKVDGKK